MFGDDDHDLIVADTILYSAGMQLAAKSARRKTAQLLIDDIAAKKFTPDVVIIDTYMGRNHADGADLATELKKYIPDAIYIAYTTLPDEEQEWANYTSIKGVETSDRSLLGTLQKVTEAQFKLDNSK